MSAERTGRLLALVELIERRGGAGIGCDGFCRVDVGLPLQRTAEAAPADCFALGHQRADLRTGERSREVGERPPRLKHLRPGAVDVVHQEHAAIERGESRLHLLPIERRPRFGRGAFQSLDHAGLVALRLQSAEKPGAGVRKSLVIEIDRVLRRQHAAQAIRAGLLEQREHRLLRRRVGRRREEAEDFVHVQDRPQAAGAWLRAHPRDHFVEQDRDEEHPLGVGEVGDRDDREPRLVLRRVQQPLHVERFAVEPTGERRRREQVVQPHAELEAILRGEEAVEIDDADAFERRLLDLVNQPARSRIAPFAPRWSSTFESRMCSRLVTGSAVTPSSASNPDAAP